LVFRAKLKKKENESKSSDKLESISGEDGLIYPDKSEGDSEKKIESLGRKHNISIDYLGE